MAVQGPLNITPYLPSPPPPLAPQRRRHCDLWIAVGILAALLALLAAAFVKFAEPAKFAYGFLSGKPSIPGCNTAIAGEATVGPLWYRVVNVACPDETTMHFVYVKRGSGPGFIVFPALMSIGRNRAGKAAPGRACQPVNRIRPRRQPQRNPIIRSRPPKQL